MSQMPDIDADALSRIANAMEEVVRNTNVIIRYIDDMIAVLAQIRENQ